MKTQDEINAFWKEKKEKYEEYEPRFDEMVLIAKAKLKSPGMTKEKMENVKLEIRAAVAKHQRFRHELMEIGQSLADCASKNSVKNPTLPYEKVDNEVLQLWIEDPQFYEVWRKKSKEWKANCTNMTTQSEIDNLWQTITQEFQQKDEQLEENVSNAQAKLKQTHLTKEVEDLIHEEIASVKAAQREFFGKWEYFHKSIAGCAIRNNLQQPQFKMK
jgi:hypothetical protein